MIRASDVAKRLDTVLRGTDIVVRSARSLTGMEAGSMVFLTRASPESIQRLNKLESVLCITTGVLARDLRCPVIVVDEPRLAFCKAAETFFMPASEPNLGTEARISPSARLGTGVSVGPGSWIDHGVRVGAHTHIGANVVIRHGVSIGAHCLIKSNTTIGERGFGFAREADGVPVQFPHLGTVCIGDHVEIGANCTVVRAALDATVVEEYVKTDDHVHIAHNCVIGARSFIAAGTILSGSVTLGTDVWIGPNATIIDQISVGDRARIGLGSVVTKPVSAGDTVFGNPARRLPDRRE